MRKMRDRRGQSSSNEVELDCSCRQQVRTIATKHCYLEAKLERSESTDIECFGRYRQELCKQCDKARIDISPRSAPGTRRGGDDQDEAVVDVTLEVGCFV